MVRLKVKVIGSGTLEDPLRVSLPTYTMIPGTEEYTDPEKRLLKSVEIEVPDDECTKGQLDKAKIRQKYRGQPLWDHPKVTDDVKPA